MHIELEVYNASEYFSRVDKEIDWHENDDTKVSIEEADAINDILTCEASIYALRRATGTDGFQVDNMVSMRRRLLDAYANKYKETYIVHNDFY